MEHERKHKDHQRREDEVANLWRTWTSEISTKLEKNGQHLHYGAMDEQGEDEEQMGCSASGRRKQWPFSMSSFLVLASMSNR